MRRLFGSTAPHAFGSTAKRAALTIILLSGGTALAATTVYRWVDEQGVVHFSDQAHPGATKLHVQDAPTFAAPPAPHTPASPSSNGPQPAERQSCSIESPSDQQMLMNAWSVSGHIRMPPAVNAGDRIILMLDGKVLPNAADLSGSFSIAQIDRGTHTLGAQVQGPDGQVICQTPPVTFYVHQPSVKAPNPVNRPRF